MVKLRRFIGVTLLLILAGLLGGGGWLLKTSSGARWLFERYGTQAAIKLTLADLSGSLLDGLELKGLALDWGEGGGAVDQLTLDWQPAALLQKRLQINLLRLGKLDVALSAATATPTAEESSLLPDLAPLLSALGDWSFELNQLQLDTLNLSGTAGQPAQFKSISGGLRGDAAQLSLRGLELDGDWGRWTGDVALNAKVPQLSGLLSWTPHQPLGPLETLKAQFSLERRPDGRLQGPVTFNSHAAKSSAYRLAGDLQLDSGGLELLNLKFDRGNTAQGLAQGRLRLGWESGFSWQTQLDLTDLNLAVEFEQQTRISGSLQLQGEKANYAGAFDLRNQASDWQHLSLKGALQGDAEHLALSRLRGHLLGGDVTGGAELDWREGLSSSFRLQGSALQLKQIPSGPEGVIDLQIDAWLKKAVGSDLQLGGAARITQGVVLKREFRGELRAEWYGGGQLQIDTLDLQGVWGHLRAQGDLQQHLVLDLDLRDASALWPPLAGQGNLTGWLAWTGDWPQGQLKGQLQGLAYENWRAAQVTIDAQQLAPAAPADIHLILGDAQQGDNHLDAVELRLQGLPAAHQLQLQLKQGDFQASLTTQGALQQRDWHAQVSTLELHTAELAFVLEQPFSVSLNPQQAVVSEILLQGATGERLSLAGDWNRSEDSLQAEGNWEQVNLALFNPWLTGVQFNGLSQGQGRYKQHKQSGISLDLLADYAGDLSSAGQKVLLDKLQIAGHWDSQGLDLSAEVLEHAGGKLSLLVSSSEAVGAAFPKRGDIRLQLENVPLGLLNARMPAGLELGGMLVARARGHWLDAGQFEVSGKLGVEHGALHYTDGQSRLELPFEQSELDLNWQQQVLVARITLGLGEGDGLAGDLSLSLPARWPLASVAEAPLAGELQFHLGKLGAFSLLFPEQLADFKGELGGALRLSGRLKKPHFSGDLQLRDGQLSLNQLGIVLEQIGVKAVFGTQQLKIERIEFKSGAGQVLGQGEILFKGWTPEQFMLELHGENALIANLPELRAVASPALQLSGDEHGWKLAGELKIPELQVLNWHPPGRITRSGDVIYVDQLPKPEPVKPLKFWLDLGVELGDKVVVKDRGLDVRLQGKFQLTKDERSEVAARGQIDIPTGHYSAYGVKLPITSGRLYFNGGAADNPALDVLALKKVREVSAGVAVGGTARQPTIRLISDPALDDTDVLSYIVLGRPTLGSSGDINVLSLAAGALLSAGDSASLQQRLQDRSGIDVIDVNTGADGGLQTAVVTVGKYLTPELYLSYGRTLTSGISQLQLRYSPTKRIEVESQLGEVSGADVYYKIEFSKIKSSGG